MSVSLNDIFFIEFITFIVSTSRVVMLTPLSKAHPAEFISAHFTVYMITSLILFNWSSTLWIRAHLSVRNDPVHILTLTGIFDSPLLEHLTIGRSMLFFSTSEAKWVAALTIYNIGVGSIRNSLGCIIAVFGKWAPFNLFVVICPRLTMPSHVFFQYIRLFTE
jgi:hypothetical protein